jgi:DNA-binding NarL/FixJ family response regulator
MGKQIKIGILEDHLVTAEGYKARLERNPRLKVNWIANFYQNVARYLHDEPADLLILDVNVLNAPGDVEPFPIQHAISDIQEKYPEVKIIVISMLNQPALIRSVQRAGASGYILKDDSDSFRKLDEILIEIATHDSIYFSPFAAKVLSNPGEIPTLSRRQMEVLSMLSSHSSLSTREMAEKLYIAPSTFRNHVSDIFLKLGVNSRTAAILRAKQLGLIADDPS